MEKKAKNYQYLIDLYSTINEYFANPTQDKKIPEIVVAFCILTERIFKIQLSKENPVLVYENTKTKEDDALVAIIKKQELSIETIRMRKTLDRYQLVFNGRFSDDEILALDHLYEIRNHFVHSHKSDEEKLDGDGKERIIKEMWTLWGKISKQAISILGEGLIKENKPQTPQKQYSETELKNVLIEEVKKKIGGNIKNNYMPDHTMHISNLACYDITGEKCPRCGAYGFSMDNQNDLNSYSYSYRIDHMTRYFPDYGSSDLYKCKACHLELTKKEYEIVKEQGL